MPMLVQICLVIVTVAIVVHVAWNMIAMIRLARAAARLTSAAELSLAQIDQVARQTREMLAEAREILPAARRVVGHFERLGDRVADLSTSVLNELEEPVLTAVAVARGVRVGTSRLMDLLSRRFASRSSSNNGDQDHD